MRKNKLRFCFQASAGDPSQLHFEVKEQNKFDIIKS